MSFKVLTEQFLTTAAVETLSTELGIVSNDTVSDLEALDLGSNSSNDTNSFMAYD